MSAIEETNKAKLAEEKPTQSIAAKQNLSFLNRFLNLLSSVRFGIILLIILGLLSFLGMLILQQTDVSNFPKWYAGLTPSERIVGNYLGLFDIYHTWYYNLLLLVLSLNIILASIERAPKTWRIVSNRKLEASKTWLTAQLFTDEKNLGAENQKSATEKVLSALGSMRLKTTVVEKNGRTHIFAEKGWWNRLGYLVVHVGLLTIFAGGFLTNQFGRNGNLSLLPGESSSQIQILDVTLDSAKDIPASLPFTVTCLDVQQKLIRKEGSIDSGNTIDWLTKVRISDEYGTREAVVQLNRPFDYRGYRFFQASFIPNGKARNITLKLTPENGGNPIEVSIPRDGSTVLQDGTTINFKDFYSSFIVGPNGIQEIRGPEYTKPVAVLEVTKLNSQSEKAMAFQMDIPDDVPIAKPVAGYKFKLVDFEKAPQAHVLALNKDPGMLPFYIGGAILIAALIGVFFFSHQRVWALVEEKEEGKFSVTFGGNTNRNQLKFEDNFKSIVNKLGARTSTSANEP